MLFVSVPNYSVHKYDKNYYSVALTNGNIGAGLVHKDDFDDFVKAHNGKDYRKTAKKVAVGLAAVGLITAGIVFRKPIAETAKKVFESVKNSQFVKKAEEFLKTGVEKTKKTAQEVTSKVKETGKKVGRQVRAKVAKVKQA